jgi:hypothetical protein
MPNKPQDLDKITRHLNERINFCKLKDNRNSRELFEALLKDFETGKFEADERDYAADIKIAERHGFCFDCIDYDSPDHCEPCRDCLDSKTKINFKPKECEPK